MPIDTSLAVGFLRIVQVRATDPVAAEVRAVDESEAPVEEPPIGSAMKAATVPGPALRIAASSAVPSLSGHGAGTRGTGTSQSSNSD